MESIRDLLPEYNSGGMDIREAGIQCREMDIRRGRMTSGKRRSKCRIQSGGKEERGNRKSPTLRERGGDFGRGQGLRMDAQCIDAIILLLRSRRPQR